MWGDGEYHPKKTLFGDTFGMRTDYTAGTFYRGRMQFLENDTENSLEPPSTFKTKKQARNASNVKQITFQKLSFPKKESEGENVPTKSVSKKVAEGTKKQIQKKQAQQAQTVVFLPSIADINKDDWSESHQAGCKMWINHSTGEVAHECPWQDAEVGDVFDEDGGGTGQLAYDSTDINELFSTLDSYRK